MATKKPKPSDGPKPPPRAQVGDIIRRYIKEGVTPNWRTDMPIWYGLWKQYPSVEFWTKHELGFRLNSIAWFLTEQGQAQLASDYTVFNYRPIPIESQSGVDTPSEPTYHSEYIAKPVRPRTVAEFLKTPSTKPSP